MSRTSKKILVLVGHPDKTSLTNSLADAYEHGARKAGYEVERINVADLTFDPVLRGGYRGKQEFEPDLVKFQNTVAWSDHMVVFFPLWWGDMPALFRGLFDRAFLPRFAFKYTGPYRWNKLLAGRSASIFPVSGTRPLILRILGMTPGAVLKQSILSFAGFKPVDIYPVWANPDGLGEEGAEKLFALFEERGARGY